MRLKKSALTSNLKRFVSSFGFQLSFGFLVVILIFSALSLFSHRQLEELAAKESEQRELLERQQTAMALMRLVEQMDAAAAGYLLSGQEDDAEQYMKSVPELERLREAVGASAVTREQREWRARMTMVTQEFVGNFERGKDVLEHAASEEQRFSQAASIHNSSQIHKQVLFDLVESFYEDYTSALNESRDEFAALIERTRTVTIWFTTAAIAVAATVAAVAAKTLYQGMRQLRAGIHRLYQGDVSVGMEKRRRDELGRIMESFDASLASIRGMLLHIRSIAVALREHSGHFRAFASDTKEANALIVKAMEEIAAGSTNQTEQAESGVRSITDMENRMKGITASVDSLLEASLSAKRSADEGAAQVRELLNGSADMGASLHEMSDALVHLTAGSTEITKITDTIHEISQQTNILALNAAIEASHAGVHGKGFSVIAEEVRKLSIETAEQSKKINKILLELQNGISVVADRAKLTADRFTDQEARVNKTGESFRSIAQWIETFDLEADAIAGQARAANLKQAELVPFIQILQSIAEETAAGVEETVAAAAAQDASVRKIAAEAETIHHHAESLFQELSRFRT